MATCIRPTNRLVLLTTAAFTLGLLFAARADAQLLRPDPLNRYLSDAPATGPMAGEIPAGMTVAGRDAQRGVPTLLIGRRLVRAAGRTPAQIAASHLVALAPSYGLGAAALGTVEIQQTRRTPGGGTVVVFRQRVNGVEVFQTRLTMLIDRHGALVAAGGELHGAAASYVFNRSTDRSVRVALADYFRGNDDGSGPSPINPAGSGRDGHPRFSVNARGVAAGYRVDEPVRAYPVLYPMPQRLVPAHYVELWTAGGVGGGPLFAYVVSAEDGRVLMRRSLTDEDVYRYDVYAGATPPFQPVDSPFGDTTPDALGMPVPLMPPTYVSQTAVSVEGLNVNPMGVADPWLPSDAMETQGNNVDAYADLSGPDGFSSGDQRAARTAPGEFVYAHDPLVDPSGSATQRQAAVTHLFFLNNWMHDYFYGAGFDEAAGNAQDDNFGRGGEEGDSLRAEAMDFSGRNNANMSTPADGSRPRMQMYLWDGYNRAFTEIDGMSYDVGTAGFGPSDFDVSGALRVVVDGAAPASDGCQAITNDLTGRIAVVDRGACSFVQKVGNATSAGAVGVIVINNVSGGTITMGGTSSTSTPSLMVSLADGATIRGLEGTTARLFRSSRPDAPSSFDSQVVIHEWGHYLHRRLVSFGEVQGRSESEGWGDYLAVFAMMNDADDLTGAYPAASWSGQSDEPIYYGIRRVPYSPNRIYNDLTFRHISRGEPLPTTAPLGSGPSDNAEVHNAGEIWATMMFDATVKMLEWSFSSASPYDFAEGRERMAHYVVTGMQLAPNDPTFTEQRDAIIAAAMETDIEDARRIALAFAGRGAGTCAVSPPRDSTDLTGVVEHYGVAPQPALGEILVDPLGAGLRCDADSIVDAGEDGFVRIEVRNDGIANMVGASLTVAADDAAVLLPSAAQPVPMLGPGMRTEMLVPMRVADMATVAGPVTFTATLSGPGLCADVETGKRVAIDRDDAIVDTVDFELPPPWFAETSLDGMTTGVWSVGASVLGDPDYVLRGIDSGGVTDTAVELPAVTVSATDPLVLSFAHRFEFEADATTWWDGGVIELSTDGGMSWEDVSTYVTPGYTGTLANTADNPLSDRPAFSGTNPSTPAADPVVLDFGTTFAGQTVRFRFRIGSDQARAAPGWEIDDLTITGGDPAPFPGYTADAADCANAPTADAGPDQTVDELTLVTLDASGSTDPNMDPLTYQWSVVGEDFGTVLSDSSVVMPTFIAPDVDEDTIVTLRVRVSDGTSSDSDDVEILVQAVMTPEPDAGPMVEEDAGPPPMPGTDAGPPPMPGTDAGRPEEDAGPMTPMDDGGCSCRTVGASPRGTTPGAPLGLGLGLLALAALARRRRRS